LCVLTLVIFSVFLLIFILVIRCEFQSKDDIPDSESQDSDKNFQIFRKTVVEIEMRKQGVESSDDE